MCYCICVYVYVYVHVNPYVIYQYVYMYVLSIYCILMNRRVYKGTRTFLLIYLEMFSHGHILRICTHKHTTWRAKFRPLRVDMSATGSKLVHT
jgi:hypothetical protein